MLRGLTPHSRTRPPPPPRPPPRPQAKHIEARARADAAAERSLAETRRVWDQRIKMQKRANPKSSENVWSAWYVQTLLTYNFDFFRSRSRSRS